MSERPARVAETPSSGPVAPPGEVSLTGVPSVTNTDRLSVPASTQTPVPAGVTASELPSLETGVVAAASEAVEVTSPGPVPVTEPAVGSEPVSWLSGSGSGAVGVGPVSGVVPVLV